MRPRPPAGGTPPAPWRSPRPLHESWVGLRVTDLREATGARVAFLIRFGTGVLPEPKTVIQAGDQVSRGGVRAGSVRRWLSPNSHLRKGSGNEGRDRRGRRGRAVHRPRTGGNQHEVSLYRTQSGPFHTEAIPAAQWLFGDACELSLLESMHLEQYDVVIAATGDDKANVVLSPARQDGVRGPRVVAQVNDPRNEWLFDSAWGVDVAVSTPRMLASLVEEAFAIGDVVRLLSSARGNANLVEVTLPDDTPWGGRPVRKLELPRDVALVTILQGQRVIVPEPDQPLEGGDELLSSSRRRTSRWTCEGC